MRVSRIVLLLVLEICLVSGCSSSQSGPKLAAADGTVNFMGKPLAGATVMFFPVKGPMAMGISDENGKFQLSTGVSRGVVVGTVNATVVATSDGKIETDPALSNRPKTPAEAEAYMKKAGEMQQAMASGATPIVQPKSLIPDKYGKADTSGLTYTINADGKNHFTIDLE